MIKIYEVEFQEYSTPLQNFVSKDGDHLAHLETPFPFLIKENQIEKVRQFGGGIKKLTFIGNLMTEE